MAIMLVSKTNDVGSIPTAPAYGLIVITGARLICTQTVGVRFPVGPLSIKGDIMAKCHFGSCGKEAVKKIRWEGNLISVCAQDSNPQKNTRKTKKK